MSLFLKLIHVLPVHEWLLLYNWYNQLNAVVKWNGSYSNVFNRGGNNASHVTNRLTKCRQSFYGLRNAGMLYPGATPDVQVYL